MKLFNSIYFIAACSAVSWLMVLLYATRAIGTDTHGDASFQLVVWTIFALTWSARLLLKTHNNPSRRH